MDAKQQFEKAFDEWAAKHPETFRLYDMPNDLLRNIAGYFYHQGAHDGIQDARLSLDQTMKELGARRL